MHPQEGYAALQPAGPTLNEASGRIGMPQVARYGSIQRSGTSCLMAAVKL